MRRPAPFVVPSDGGTMLGAAAVLGFLSFFSHLEAVHLGRGPIPVWVPLAVDAGIAAAAGLLLTFAARWFSDEAPEAAEGYVVVSKPVWESVQKEVVAARATSGPSRPPALPSPTPVSLPVSDATPALNPWDEGPPVSPPPVAERVALPISARTPPRSPPGVLGAPAAKVEVPPVLPAARPVTPSTPPAAPMRAPTPAPAPAPAPAAPDRRPVPEADEIAQMGRIMGIEPRPGESAAEFAQRVAREVDLGPSPAAPVTVAPAPAKAAPPTAPGTPDIDELMGWLEKMAAEKESARPGSGAKKAPPSSDSSSDAATRE